MRFTVLACRYDSFYTYFNFQSASDLAADACSAPGAARERPDCPPAQTGATLSAPIPVAAHEPGRREGLRDAVREAGKARGKELVPPEGFTVPCALIDDEASRRRPRHQADGYTIAAIETKACRNGSSQRRSRSGTPRCRPTANGEISRATSAILPRTTVFDGGSGLSTLPASGPELAGGFRHAFAPHARRRSDCGEVALIEPSFSGSATARMTARLRATVGRHERALAQFADDRRQSSARGRERLRQDDQECVVLDRWRDSRLHMQSGEISLCAKRETKRRKRFLHGANRAFRASRRIASRAFIYGFVFRIVHNGKRDVLIILVVPAGFRHIQILPRSSGGSPSS